jgi:hypothetical protein
MMLRLALHYRNPASDTLHSLGHIHLRSGERPDVVGAAHGIEIDSRRHRDASTALRRERIVIPSPRLRSLPSSAQHGFSKDTADGQSSQTNLMSYLGERRVRMYDASYILEDSVHLD